MEVSGLRHFSLSRVKENGGDDPLVQLLLFFVRIDEDAEKY
jgi:hypothetical protein